ncbi:bile acid:sodium symporter family protein [Pseudobacter ginsenosidimutans]|uniref:BASS family bile acid:Na+ symporter n=1 Tax=Pseudobacter ginsenosidimutans TaxID=661488 RepID=A0A4Q7MBS1_9BACT|nr:bile acid:sodium symporter family protein [Pseudobacter ginsenosidimutans]QEC45197.1 bile acid:sodium symporter family protein [Pseudobacter ginsenosidimutans]RZS65466.1 BASS family bile acid:Na+ symporter [Pseudobacter ginsenosidimutans]
MAVLNKSVYNFCYTAALLFLLAFVYTTLHHYHNWAGVLLALFFVSIALAFRGSRLFRGYWYSIVIFAVATIAMYYPQHFISVGGRNASFFIPVLLQVIMFGMGTELSLKDFAQVMRMPKGVFIGTACHYIIMPLVGFAVAHLFSFPNEIAAGIILIGCCPSGLASNVMCYLARANLALSVSVTTISTLLAPFLTPLLMKLLGGRYVEIDLWAMVWEITKIVIIPIAAGLAFHYLVRGKVKWIDKIMPVISMVGIALVLLVITAAGRDNLLKIGGLLIVATFIHNISGYFLGYWSARFFKFPEKDCRTIALEVGMQNAGLASALARGMGKLATVGLASVIFGTMMNVTGSSLASWWHNRSPQDGTTEKELS